eukprot:CAMPEP_0195032016 /NCGR_PEP_ID=MMETSP0326_2-20130528/62586_1 /TAXON_ID=2866 ORGANISM="Crypthecodinium cohnii, Strain Seligo" /NCGR_SAMPLE_ID=MMETSP0326_2 /ASSEMBLY_ACC=CAM_ASM_000348 /LENGTH=138 /DNA_ID=CAMNT_0040055977 /DNA_START=410 /DNA_END=822 /DNA_ORIENTATION=+
MVPFGGWTRVSSAGVEPRALSPGGTRGPEELAFVSALTPPSPTTGAASLEPVAVELATTTSSQSPVDEATPVSSSAKATPSTLGSPAASVSPAAIVSGGSTARPASSVVISASGTKSFSSIRRSMSRSGRAAGPVSSL